MPKSDEVPVASTEATEIRLTPEQFDALLKQAAKGEASPALDAVSLAKAMQQVGQRENVQAPMVSVYNPRGDRDHPKPRFVAQRVTQNGVRLSLDTLTVEEVEAVNLLPPGVWKVHKANDTVMPLTVEVEYEPDGVTATAKRITFPCKTEEQRYDQRSLLEYTLEVLEQAGMSDERDRLLALRRELNALRAAS